VNSALRRTGLRLPPLGRWLPAYPGSWLLTDGLNRLVMHRLDPDLRSRLEGQAVRISIVDAGFEFAFRVERGRCRATGLQHPPALRVAATALDFAAIAAGSVDADTLFFQRRLELDGDVELATMVRNALDAVEFPRLRGLLRSVLDALPGARGDDAS
jgi:predicted lipid carrier protein YhbT